ncbi:4'-phosphopantetheinyl transferase family protein [Clavibacter michiganensis]|uniref:4'-phosphopantetheinyl transferase n=1 Tax=Clavibacter michiganensis subsp. insidiosus TaxID=33014 RepID=A0A0D5CGG1_9MICO|nr:hypothetical protein [Clavibacter michiganensis]AJW78701.1 hypothetical protein VO01_05765 [Clavibacter michiganensis subsp. insidiosus]AWF98638.1 hypothetical protein BEH61_08990 [Clavibacter michiganensis subsp. insidiosus]AWG01146.1 hypothetical protein BEH62_05995 [Clavibacter michiganensis subsp. insidiosus]OQJ60293.1 hypothetical protein B5P21_10495 [Clavibacter michiganensis subsp. insidiosus]RII88771.1 4'-phosphopantetheinyl transferase [Clavibacter michiganensis subsp. insidiosus]
MAGVEVFGDLTDLEHFASEEDLLVGASAARLAEFRTARSCARQALQLLGSPASNILRGHDRAPIWSAGVTGSITHRDGYRAAVVAKKSRVSAIVIDAEQDLPLPDGVADMTLTAPDWASVRGLTANHNWDRLLFSAKEAVFMLASGLGAPTTIDIIRVHTDGQIDVMAREAGFDIDARWVEARGLLVTAVAARTR